MPQINANGARFHYRLEGDPAHPPIVLVHPLGADHGLWDKVVPLLTPWACVMRYDLRGHGASEVTDGDYSLELMSSDLLALAEEIRLGPFFAVGISLGALTVLDAAARAPGRVQGVVACSVAMRIPPPPQGWAGRAQAVRDSGTAPLGQAMVERMFSAAFRESRDPAIETLRSTLVRMDRRGYAGACAVLRDADLGDVLPRIGQPAVIVSGTDDALTPPLAASELADSIPHGVHVVLPGGHFPSVERPNDFASLLRDAMRASPESTAGLRVRRS